MLTPAELLAGRLRNEPKRDTEVYARLRNLGGWQTNSSRQPLIKPTPTNLRQFARTTFARRAIRRIKDPIANLAWEIGPKKGVELNSELQKQIDVATLCFEQPNHDDSARTFLEQLVEDMCINGAGPYEHQLGGDLRRPLWMWPVDTLSIQINAAWTGKAADPRYYQSLGYGNVGGTLGTPLRNDELVYIRTEPTTENPFGLGALEVAFAAINRKLGVAEYAGDLASNAQPENLLIFQGMNQEVLNAFRMYWRNEIEGQGQTPIQGVPANAEAQVLKLRGTDDEALFLKWQEFLIREIATAFCINALCLGVHGDVNRATAEVIDDMDWDNAVVPTATSISAYFTRETLHGRLGYSQLEHRFLGLKRDDKLAEAQIYEYEYQNNAATPNEYRARNSMPPLDSPWADMTYADVQIAMQAAKGAAEVDDPALPKPRKSSSSKKPK
jgi:phage portal protein BeeE